MATQELTSPAVATSGQVGDAQRLAWVDIAKASAIILVVFYHVGRVGLGMAPGVAGDQTRPWLELNKVLLPVRMPVFFLVSGLLAARAVHYPWSRVLGGKVLNLLWPYVGWTIAFGFTWVYAYFPDDKTSWFVYNLEMIPFGGLAYWYLTTLVVFFLVAKLLRRFAPALLIVSVVLLAMTPAITGWIGAGQTQSLTANVVRWTAFALWFFIGCFAADVVKRAATVRGWGTTPVAVGAYVVLAYLFYYRDTPGGVEYFLSPVGITAAVLLSVRLAHFAAVRRLGRYLATRTLAIYVLHPILIHILVIVAGRTGRDPLGDLNNPVVNFLFVPVMAVALTAAAVAIFDLAGKLHLSWLFQWPWPARAVRGPQMQHNGAVPGHSQ